MSPAASPEPQPVVAAIVTSHLGVLAGRRNDGKPPWTFIAGEIDPGELAEVRWLSLQEADELMPGMFARYVSTSPG